MNDNFIPFRGYIEVSPIDATGVLVSDEKKWTEKAIVINFSSWWQKFWWKLTIGSIVFFRPHGFFELVEHEGKKHYVVRVSPEFILGIIKHEPSVAKQ